MILYRDVYEAKMLELLEDRSTYAVLNFDPTNKFRSRNNKLVSDFINRKFITAEVGSTLKVYNDVSPKIYGLPKTHKRGLPLRPVTSCVDSPSYKMSKFIASILRNINSVFKYSVKNSYELKDSLHAVELPVGYILVSLDVSSLFTNIPAELVVEAVKRHWNSISMYTNITEQAFIDAVHFIFEASYCVFNKIFYKQFKGTPMGSPSSPVFAEMVMTTLLDTVLPSLPFSVPFLYLYVDDILTAVPCDKLDVTLQIFNSYHPCLQFTSEVEVGNTIPFLDMSVIRYDNKLITNWYQKPMATGRLINFGSCHSNVHKIGVIKSLVRRVMSLSDARFYRDNCGRIKSILRMNGYPGHLINKIMSSMNTRDNASKQSTVNDIVRYRVPFVPLLTNRIRSLLNTPTVEVVPYYGKSVGSIYSKLKDKVNKQLKSSIIYEVPCLSCPGKYIGQTKNYLRTRINQHKLDCRHIEKSGTTALSRHAHDLGHVFGFDDVRILDTEPILKKRLIKEMIYINREPHSVNDRTDIDGLSVVYLNLIK